VFAVLAAPVTFWPAVLTLAFVLPRVLLIAFSAFELAFPRVVSALPYPVVMSFAAFELPKAPAISENKPVNHPRYEDYGAAVMLRFAAFQPHGSDGMFGP
jgi:hypothetical protein